MKRRPKLKVQEEVDRILEEFTDQGVEFIINGLQEGLEEE